MHQRREILAFLASASLSGMTRPLAAATLNDWIEGLGVAKLFVSAGIPSKSYYAASTKMMPNLAEQDVVLADLRQGGKQPDRGEIIVSWRDDTVYLDRVIGLPGDRIALRRGQIVLNGQEIEQQPAGTIDYDVSDLHQKRSLFTEALPGARPYKIARNLETGGYLDDIPETLVVPDHLYLLGDNRDNSVDSRVKERGQVAIEKVIGRVVYRLRPNAGWLVPRETVQGLPQN